MHNSTSYPEFSHASQCSPSSLPPRPPRIGITGSILADTEPGWAGLERSYANDHFVRAIAENGGVPFILPLLHSPANTPSPAFLSSIASQLAAMDGLVITGGHDLHPSWYGEEPEVHLAASLPERDLFDMAVLAAAIRAKKPILGICRGMQLINVFLGGTLIQDLGDHQAQVAETEPRAASAEDHAGAGSKLPGAANSSREANEMPRDRRGTVQHLQQGGFYQPTHKVQIQGNSALAAIVGGADPGLAADPGHVTEPGITAHTKSPSLTLEVNSLHHQAVDRVASPLKAVAWAQDGVIEAIELARNGLSDREDRKNLENRNDLETAEGNGSQPPSFWKSLGLDLSIADVKSYLKTYPFLLGVQWHPEMLFQPTTRGNEVHNKIFLALVGAAGERESLPL